MTLLSIESTAPMGESIAHVVEAAFRQREWDARAAAPGSRPDQISDAKVVTGTIQSLWREATSHVGYTEIDSHFTFQMEIRDPKTVLKHIQDQ